MLLLVDLFSPMDLIEVMVAESQLVVSVTSMQYGSAGPKEFSVQVQLPPHTEPGNPPGQLPSHRLDRGSRSNLTLS